METPDPHNLAASGSLGENQQRVKDGAGLLTSAALKKLDEDLPWYRALPKEDRAWVSVVAQSGISSFVSWFINPELGVQSAGDMFAAAPRT